MRRHSALAVLISLFFLYLFAFQPQPGAWLHGSLDWRAAFFSSRVDWPQVGHLLLDLRPLPFLGALLCLVLSLVIRAWRWRVISSPLDRVPLLRMFHLTNLGYMANNLLPMRLGEVLRAGALSARSRIPLAGALATIVLERVLDMAGALVVLLLMLLLQGELFAVGTAGSADGLAMLSRFRGLLPVLGGLTCLGLGLLAGLVIWRQRFLDLVEGLLLRFLPRKVANRLCGLFHSFARGLEILRSPWEALLLLVLTGLLNACYLASLGAMIHAYHLGNVLPAFHAAPVASLLLLLVFVSLGYMIPAAPGAFGTVQYFTALAMGLLGAGTEQAMSFALGNHLITWLLLTLLGLLALPLLKLSFADLMQWKEKGA